MPGKYFSILDPNVPPMQHRRSRVPVEAKEVIETKLREPTVQDIIIPWVEPTPSMSSLTHPYKANGTLKVC